MNTRQMYKLEERIMECYAILEDIELALEVPSEARDKVLEAIHTLYAAKFEKLSETFSDILRGGFEDVHAYNCCKREQDMAELDEDEEDEVEFDASDMVNTGFDITDSSSFQSIESPMYDVHSWMDTRTRFNVSDNPTSPSFEPPVYDEQGNRNWREA